MLVFDSDEAKNHFSELVARAQRGEEIIIAMDGKPAAHLLPHIAKDAARPLPGIDKGKVTIQPDFDAPLPEFDQ